MRLINQQEIEQVSGGVGVGFLLSFVSGMQGFSFPKTVFYSTAFYALWGGVLLGIVLPVAGFPLGLAIGGLDGAIEGAAGYGLGSLFAKDEPAPRAAA